MNQAAVEYVVVKVFPLRAWGKTPAPKEVAVFPERETAEAHCRELHEEAFQEVNPFLYGERLQDFTSMPPAIFHDWLLEMGLDAPNRDRIGGIHAQKWRRWWQFQGSRITSEVRFEFSQVFDRLHLFKVIERAAGKRKRTLRARKN